ncbi:tigger transposable element-derived protein 1-like [Elysia marginata]|uniref:Tigger transposable element-derived protein 1-like n=1 Tax=Elysia marginata TaxID=1093978 RepID=A0AAV4FXP1_9GAST|nr:tigger transposable element-derived protein 1-like [Elysia marginata]
MAAASRRGSWSQQDLENAMRAINRGEGISVREAAKHFGISRRTLRNHVSIGSVVKRLGRKSLMPAEEEQMLVNPILRFANVGLPLTAKMIQSYVFEYFKKNYLEHPFTSNLAGEKWFRLFLNRHPELRYRKAQAMNPARAQKLNRFIVNDHYCPTASAFSVQVQPARPHRLSLQPAKVPLICQCIKSFDEWAEKPEEVFQPTKDAFGTHPLILAALLEHIYDHHLQQDALQQILKGASNVLKRQLGRFLDGDLANPTEDMLIKSAGLVLHLTISVQSDI